MDRIKKIHVWDMVWLGAKVNFAIGLIISFLLILIGILEASGSGSAIGGLMLIGVLLPLGLFVLGGITAGFYSVVTNLVLRLLGGLPIEIDHMRNPVSP